MQIVSSSALNKVSEIAAVADVTMNVASPVFPIFSADDLTSARYLETVLLDFPAMVKFGERMNVTSASSLVFGRYAMFRARGSSR